MIRTREESANMTRSAVRMGPSLFSQQHRLNLSAVSFRHSDHATPRLELL